MGIYDREYTQAGRQSSPGGGTQLRYGLPRVTPAVKWLLITNTAIFLFEAISGQMERDATNYFEKWGAIIPASWLLVAEVWRLLTHQFLHGSLWHIVFNMLALYFIGPRLEAFWGTKKFLGYYLLCGAAGGLIYTVVGGLGILRPLPMVGASGAILGVLVACAILFPGDIIFLLFFPLPIRIAVIVLTGIFVVGAFAGCNKGGDLAHLGGMAAGATYVLFGSRLGAMMTTRRRSAWDRKMDQQRRLQLEVDRILDKVHEKGLASLSRDERNLLQEATKLEREKKVSDIEW